MGGIGGASTATIAFQIWARLDGQSYPCHLQADFFGSDRILGRDVLNGLDILFPCPLKEVVINP